MAPRERIKLCAVDGVTPNQSSIREREYPFVTEVYAVTRADQSQGSKAYQVWSWLRSPQGQALIAKSGYVALD